MKQTFDITLRVTIDITPAVTVSLTPVQCDVSEIAQPSHSETPISAPSTADLDQPMDLPITQEPIDCSPREKRRGPYKKKSLDSIAEDLAVALPGTVASIWEAICKRWAVGQHFNCGDVMAEADIDFATAKARLERLKIMHVIELVTPDPGHLETWKRFT